MSSVLSALRRGTTRTEIAAGTGLPDDLVELIIHENRSLATGADRVDLVAMVAMASEPATPSCPPVGCRGCFFAQGCPSFTPAP